ncbi:hypothetical protein T4B_5335 [Trichinella pseudospiralis]|uniref:Uncharacterized protein n=1 Tax=Trichinella pseudospiralis TaxID=6337 RepID=A0A0V1G9G5_TRIPS|nr:hypothetical protein T4B_5335 [Trichinella pseudospiralis]KRY96076.1 hypothetical protein T4C_8652 [Trichinella pseudospiralis]
MQTFHFLPTDRTLVIIYILLHLLDFQAPKLNIRQLTMMEIVRTQEKINYNL